MTIGKAHIPVLLEPIMDSFKPEPGHRLLDATVGLGGHSLAYLKVDPATSVVGFDADPQAIEAAKTTLTPAGPRFKLINSNFAHLKDSLEKEQVRGEFNHILFDLGVGSHQLSDPSRSFSFRADSGLSMRYGSAKNLPDSLLPAINALTRYLGYFPDVGELIHGLAAKDLTQLIRQYGEERYAGRIATHLKEANPFPGSGTDLAAIISNAVPSKYRQGRINPATRTFQALRLAVNRELEVLKVALEEAVALLGSQGLIAVISFHSLEDRIVKHFFREHPHLEVKTKKPITPSPEEIIKNPRSRSAKLRIAQKIT